MTLRVAVLVAVAMAGGVHSAFACFLLRGDPHALVREADVIVRARASAVSDQPAPSSIRSESRRLVHFGVLEQLKGEALLFGEDLLFSVTAEGTLTDRPDMNPKPVPYGMVRPGGSGGGCHAFNYQHGGEYLLLLKRVDGKLTPYWASLGATNEQISGEHDPWVAWVRQQLESIRQKGRHACSRRWTAEWLRHVAGSTTS